MLEFDKDSHVYRLDGAPIPSVTQVLAEAGLVDTQWFTEHARWRGSAVHLACWYHDQDDLDESTVPDELRGYLEAYKLFKREHDFQINSIEEPRCHQLFRYAGTVDRDGILDGKDSLVDLKTGGPVPAYAIQLAGYGGLTDSPYRYERVNLQLSQDGKYKLHRYPMASFADDFKIFMAALTVANWRRSKGIA